MNITKSYYELSVWQDRYVTGEQDGIPYSYYDEDKFAVIGSSDMTTQARAFSINMTENVNGTHKLTFKLYFNYFDEKKGDFVPNPYINFIVNETRIKYFFQGKWYDFVVKKVDDKSSDYCVTYNCEDQYITELSKNGFNLEYSTDLYNNTDTAGNLVKQTLKGTDWQFDEEGSDTFLEGQVEPVFAFKIPQGTYESLYSIENDIHGGSSDRKELRVEANQNIRGFFFYSDYVNWYSATHDGDTSVYPTKFQFIWKDGAYSKDQWSVDEDNVVTQDNDYYYFEVNTNLLDLQGNEAAITNSTFMKAKKRVKRSWTHYDPLVEGVVSTVYLNREILNNPENLEALKKAFEEVDPLDFDVDDISADTKFYKWIEEDYEASNVLTNLIVNPENFTDGTGWVQCDNDKASLNKNATVASVVHNAQFNNGDLTTYLNVGESSWYRNAAIHADAYNIEKGINVGDIYRLKIELGTGSVTKIFIGTESGDPLFTGISSIDGYYRFKANKSLTGRALKKNLHKNYLYIKFSEGSQLKKAELFPEIIGLDENGESYYCNIGDTPIVVRTSYTHIYPAEVFTSKEKMVSITYTNSQTVITTDSNGHYQAVPTQVEPSNWENYFKEYKGNGTSWEEYESVRSIEIKESNRFNIISEICETFKCWARYEIQHDFNGHITIEDIYDKTTGQFLGKRPIKKVRLFEYLGKLNNIGLHYGLNLKGVTRTVDTVGLVTKVIIKANSNEFAKDGSCNIARARANPGGLQYLYNFDYFIKTGLLKNDDLLKDLYSYDLNDNSLSFYLKMKKIITAAQNINNMLSPTKTSYLKLESNYTTYNALVEKSEEQIADANSTLQEQYGTTYDPDSPPSGIFGNTGRALSELTGGNVSTRNLNIINLINTIITATNNLKGYKTILNNIDRQRKEIQGKIKGWEADLDELNAQRLALETKFYSKYYKYIFEGTWNSDEYIDDDLYYYDAASVLDTSSKPKLTYTFDALALNGLKDYDLLQFELGDKTYVDDVEFWGYEDHDFYGKVPYRVEVIITELTTNPDEPDQYKIKVQNYATRFEDLFQRVAASTQQLQLNEGQYVQGSLLFTSSSSIVGDLITTAIANNAAILENLACQSVVWDDRGITITEDSNSGNIVRLVAGGIVLSQDGGDTWTTGISAQGINASKITTGQLDANKIRIMSGDKPAFVWNKSGLNALWTPTNESDPAPDSEGNWKFVRFDKHGLYGINDQLKQDGVNISYVDYTPTEQQINDRSTFALNWSGLKLNQGGDITVKNGGDIIVKDGGNVIIENPDNLHFETEDKTLRNYLDQYAADIFDLITQLNNNIQQVQQAVSTANSALAAAENASVTNYNYTTNVINGAKYEPNNDGATHTVKIDDVIIESDQSCTTTESTFSVDDNSTFGCIYCKQRLNTTHTQEIKYRNMGARGHIPYYHNTYTFGAITKTIDNDYEGGIQDHDYNNGEYFGNNRMRWTCKDCGYTMITVGILNE